MIKHLNHELELSSKAEIDAASNGRLLSNEDNRNIVYKCEKCGMFIMYYSKLISISFGDFYWSYSNDNGRDAWEELILTCEEIIIKNIIE